MKAAAVLMILFDILFLPVMVTPATMPVIILDKLAVIIMMCITTITLKQRREIIPAEAEAAEAVTTMPAMQSEASTVCEIIPAAEAAAVVNDDHDDHVQPVNGLHIKGNNQFAGMNAVITGKFAGFTRDQAKAVVNDNGGTAWDVMPDSFDLLIAGDEAYASWIEYAYHNGIRVMYADEFTIASKRPLSLEIDEFIDLMPRITKGA